MKKSNVILMVIAVVTLISFVVFATYAYYSSTASINNIANVNATSERNNMAFVTTGGAMSLNVTMANMAQAVAGNIAAQNNTTLTVSFTANTPYSMVCSYDIVYEWTSSDKYKAHSSGVTAKEFSIKAILQDNVHVYVGNNKINFDNDLTSAVGNQTSATVVSGAQIDGSGNTTSTAVWNLESKFYNVDANQSALSGKTYAGKFKVTNVSCVAGTVQKLGDFDTYWFSSSLGTYKTFPATGGTVHTSGPSTGQRVYIAQNSTQYYACGYYDGKEICLNQPFTQYGLTGHTVGQDFTAEEQASAKAAILQVFNNAGINIALSNCSSGRDYVMCNPVNFNCAIFSSGNVYCRDASLKLGCNVTPSNTARCYSY